MPDDISQQLTGLSHRSRSELRQMWRELFHTPRLPRQLLIQVLAYHPQVLA